ncbi:MAG: response regulator [Thermostichus sp. DG_1_6_bins_120]
MQTLTSGDTTLTRRVLVVDDEDDIREVAQLSLEIMAGWEVWGAPSGKEGIRIAETTRPDVILLDVMMPDMDGPTTFRQLQANPKTQDIPVILLTAKVRARLVKEQFLPMGVCGVITKPFDATKLADQVAETVGWDLSSEGIQP